MSSHQRSLKSEQPLKPQSQLVSELSEALQGADLVFIADVHLKGASSNHAALLKALIEGYTHSRRLGTPAPAKAHLVLGGDIFDFLWATRAGYFQKKAAFLRESLKPLSSRGVRVSYLQGNHEFSLSELAWTGVEILGSSGATLHLECPEKSFNKVGVSHGDLWGASPLYKMYHRMMHAAVTRFVARIAFKSEHLSRWCDDLAHQLSGMSRYRSRRKRLPHTDILLRAAHEAVRRGERVHLFGHFHHPYAVEVKAAGRPILLLSVSSWSHQPSALVLRSTANLPGLHVQRVMLQELREATGTRVVMKVEDVVCAGALVG